MFTHKELVAELPRLSTLVSPQLEVAEFGNLDFNIRGSEQNIWAFRGSKQEFANALFFWVKALQAQGWEGRETYFISYAAAALCEPISELEFSGLVAEYSNSLSEPLPAYLRDLDGIRAAMRMYNEWNDIGAVAELADSFVAFFWSTTA